MIFPAETHDFPSIAGWLTPTDPPLAKLIIYRAFSDLGLCELPPSSNRSPIFDAYLHDAGADDALILSGMGYYCGAAVRKWWHDAGAEVPPAGIALSVEGWRKWAISRGLLRATPALGRAILSGTQAHVDHMAIVARIQPILRSIEGNTSIAGYTRNGEGVEMKIPEPARIVGYIEPIARAA